MKKSVEKDKHICLQYAKQYIFKDSSNHEYISGRGERKDTSETVLVSKKTLSFHVEFHLVYQYFSVPGLITTISNSLGQP